MQRLVWLERLEYLAMRVLTRTTRHWSLALAIALGVCVPCLAVAVTDQERSAARELAEKGDRAYRAGQYEESLDLFSRASALVPAPTVLLFVARSNAQLRRLVQAREAYGAILRQALAPDAPQAFRAAHESARVEVEDIERRLPRVTVSSRGAPGTQYRVLLDGAEMSRALFDVAQPIDPGEHAFELAGEGVEAASVTRTIAEGSRETVTFDVQPVLLQQPPRGSSGGDRPRSHGPSRVPAYVSLGIGALGLGFGTVMGVRHFSRLAESSELFDDCNPRFCNPEELGRIDELDRQASVAGTLAIVGGVVGAIGVGTGLFLALRTPGDERPAAALRLSPGGASVVGSF